MLIVDILDYDEPASLALGFPNDIAGPLLRSVPLLHPPRLPPAVFNPRLHDPEPLQLTPEPPRESRAPAPPPRPRSRGPREAERRGDERDENQNFRRQVHEGIRGFIRGVVLPALDPHLLHALKLLEPLTRGEVVVRGEQVLEQGSGDGGVRRVAGFGSFSFSFSFSFTLWSSAFPGSLKAVSGSFSTLDLAVPWAAAGVAGESKLSASFCPNVVPEQACKASSSGNSNHCARIKRHQGG